MPTTTAAFALAAMLGAAGLLQACAGATPTQPAGERSGVSGSRAPISDVDRFPQARNASPYMRQ